jgi:hypothetical protein
MQETVSSFEQREGISFDVAHATKKFVVSRPLAVIFLYRYTA